jgi:Rad3-related DNA helicase
MYLARKLYRPTLIVDEAHTLIPTIRELNAKHIWTDELQLPSSVRTYGQLYRWLQAKRTPGPKHIQLMQELEQSKTRCVITRGSKEYYGQDRECLFLNPVDVRDSPPLLWPQGKVNKLILMSATFNRKDVEQLGLDKKRVVFVEAESIIPSERRPVVLESKMNMSYAHQEANLPKLADYIRKLLTRHEGERGFIHITYGMIRGLRHLLADEPRLIWHTSEDKLTKYQQYRKTENAVLMAAGMYEGVDLPQDMGRFQLITKVPWPSLADPAIKFMADSDEEWYGWEAAKLILQATGRICRGPEDYGVTYICDSTFDRLFTRYREFFPQWYADAVHDTEVNS